MKSLNRFLAHAVLALALGIGLTACDQSEQNFDFEPGTDLTVVGPSSVTLPNYDSTATGEYYIRAFTIEREYTWETSGAATDYTTRREGEYADVTFSQVGTGDVTVTTTIDGQQYSGTATTAADYPAITEQAGKYGLSILLTALTEAELVDAITGTTVTGFTPSDAAFLAALDADDDGTLAAEELPPVALLQDILAYHVVPDSVTAGDITAGSVPTLLDGWELDLTTGPVAVDGTPVTVPDIAVSNGVLHKIGGVLLPDALVSFADQTAEEGPTVTVNGTYMAEGGFVVMHDSTSLADDGAIPSVVGVSEYLEPGFHASIEVSLDDAVTSDVVLVAMPHRDSNDNDTYDFEDSGGADDGPYVNDAGDPVTENGTVSAPESG